MRKLLTLAALCAAATALTATSALAAPPADKDTLYALGASMASSVKIFALTPAEAAIVAQGFKDGVAGKPRVDPQAKMAAIQQLAQARAAEGAKATKAEGDAFRAKAGKSKGAQTTASGLVYIEQSAGQGPSPTLQDTVTVHYKGTLIDGSEFDSSYSRGEPTTFPLGRVVPCWREGVAMMKKGGKARLVCPPDLAYG
ncbi:MAG: FKBP-type peptidyl-prolyl cis-trans isomerase, partial [Myxococcales bacterium]|nr:FKBP-type peptidyl-prolyl cis-trans isomerase [Myxococcales bacterium]